MQITINVNAPELAQAILSLSAALSGAASPKVQEVNSSPAQGQPVQPTQQINTETPQQAAQAYGVPVGQPVPVTGQITAQAPTAPAQQAPDNQALSQEQKAQHAPTTAPTSAPSYDFNQIATATMQLQEAGHNIFELLSQFGIQALNQLPKERYGEYANALRERGAKL